MQSVDTVPTASPAAANTQPRRAGADLDRSLVRGIAWTSAVTWVSQILSWASTIIVVHYLLPADYGLIGMALVYLQFAQVASELGVGAAVLRFQNLSSNQIGQFNSVSVLAGSACMVASWGLAVPVGYFFHQPRLPIIIVVMSVNFLISAFRVVPQSLLERQLQFRTLALFDGTKAIVVASSTLIMAKLGFGYWTLALAPLIGATVYALLVIPRSRVPFHRPQLASIKEPFQFSNHMLMSRFAWFAFSNADFVIIGKVLNEVALGAYMLGWTLAGMAVEKITALVGRVTPAFFSAVQNDMAAMRRYLLLITEGLAVLTFPVCVGLALVARDVVLLVMRSQWTDAIMPLRLLALVATFRSIQPLIPQVVAMLGESRRNMNNTLLTVIVLPVGFFAATQWGISGVAAAWLILYPVLAAPLFVYVFKRIELPTRAYLGALWPAISGCLVMSVVVISLERIVFDGPPSVMAMVVKIVAGAVAYAGSLMLFHRKRVLALRDMVRTVRSRRGESAPLAAAEPAAEPVPV